MDGSKFSTLNLQRHFVVVVVKMKPQFWYDERVKVVKKAERKSIICHAFWRFFVIGTDP